jgi:hypothetical protein
VASFLSVLVSHMSRIIDRSRAINVIPDDDPNKALALWSISANFRHNVRSYSNSGQTRVRSDCPLSARSDIAL